MRTVLYVQPSSEIGGSEIALLRLISHLDRERYRPVAVIPADGEFGVALRDAGSDVRILPMLPLRPATHLGAQLSYAGKFLPTVVALKRLARREGASLIHSNSLYSLYGAFAGHGSGKAPRLVWHVREIPDAPAALAKPLLRLAESRAARLICVSDAVRAQFSGRSPAVVVHDGVDVGTFDAASPSRIRSELGIPPAAQVVGWVGRLDPWKGVRVFIAAARELQGQFPGVHFVVAGGELRGHLRHAQEARNAAKRELGEAVHFTEWKYGPADIPDLMASFDVLVQTSVTPEPFGLTLIEAMAARTPVVAPAAGGPVDIVEDGATGVLVAPGDVDGYARAIASLLSDRELATQMGEAGRQRCETHFSIGLHARRVQSIYDALLGAS